MNALVILCLSVAAATASVLPSYGGGWGGYGSEYGSGYGAGYGGGWGDYGKLGGYGGGYGGYGHHAPATSYANVWKVDHGSHPVIVKPHHAPVSPLIKTYPSLGYAAWDHGHVPSYGSDPWAVTGLGAHGYGAHGSLGGLGGYSHY